MKNHTNHTSPKAKTRLPAAPQVFGTATVGERGQVVIPQSAREWYGIKAGDRLVVLGGAGGADGLLLIRAETVGELLADVAGKLTSFRDSVQRATEAE